MTSSASRSWPQTLDLGLIKTIRSRQESRLSCRHSTFLHVESPHETCRPHELRQQQRIATIAAGGIDHPVPRLYPLPQKEVGKSHRSA